ncbi:MAG: DsbA family protein [Caldilineales bacterium]|nr:DsbA family protein [Caldilineales bacterium]MCW5859078.1 DsbA family protein [Caldilineales bacterium]
MTKKIESPAPRKGSKPISEAEAKQQASSRRWLWLVAGAGVALLALLAVVALLNSRQPSPTVAAGSSIAAAVGQPADGRTLGDPNAPVTIVAYEDFQCPHCQDFNRVMEKTIREDLVKPGIARFEFKHRFVIGNDSMVAAMAAECAADQGRFWEYHDVLLASLRQDPRAVQISDFEQRAADIGLDTAAFAKCLESQKYKEAMLREDIEARDKGVNSTPTIFINDVKYEGAFDPAAFKAAVEQAKSGS